MAVPDEERSRAGAETGTWKALAEVPPEPRELSSLESGLGWQDRVQDPRFGACSLVGDLAAGFAWHYRCSKVPPHSWEGGKVSTSPALVEGGEDLMPHWFIGQRAKASGQRLGKASWLLWPHPAQSCCLLVLSPSAGSPACPSPLRPPCPLSFTSSHSAFAFQHHPLCQASSL